MPNPAWKGQHRETFDPRFIHNSYPAGASYSFAEVFSHMVLMMWRYSLFTCAVSVTTPEENSTQFTASLTPRSLLCTALLAQWFQWQRGVELIRVNDTTKLDSVVRWHRRVKIFSLFFGKFKEAVSQHFWHCFFMIQTHLDKDSWDKTVDKRKYTWLYYSRTTKNYILKFCTVQYI